MFTVVNYVLYKPCAQCHRCTVGLLSQVLLNVLFLGAHWCVIATVLSVLWFIAIWHGRPTGGVVVGAVDSEDR